MHNIKRPFWLDRLQQAWKKRPIVWLTGVRRTGKTTLAGMLPDTVYLNCDLPSTLRRLEDPESFYKTLPKNSILILDEIHRLPDPSRTLKIAADAYPHLRILATGSSTLSATTKFKDALTGRKLELFLPPVLLTETQKEFGIPDIHDRLQRGGLPELLLHKEPSPELYSEWIDSFYARDIQELFSVRNRTGFLTFFRLLLRRSGNLMEATSLSQESGISRPTLSSYLEALSIAHAIFLLPPFHGGGKRELLKRPKVYAFDTGFVAFENGWDRLRPHEQGVLFEHLVLDALRVMLPEDKIHFWQDKAGREVDFIIKTGRTVRAIECKLNPDQFKPDNLAHFRTLYPDGENFVISPGIEKTYHRKIADLDIVFCGMSELMITENWK